MTTTIDVTREQAIGASRKYLNARGYEVEGTWEQEGLCGLVASDEDGLAFVQVQYKDADSGEEPTDPKTMRDKFERAAIGWLSDNEECYSEDFPVRFDIISLLLMSRKRALLRHHLNVLGTC